MRGFWPFPDDKADLQVRLYPPVEVADPVV